MRRWVQKFLLQESFIRYISSLHLNSNTGCEQDLGGKSIATVLPDEMMKRSLNTAKCNFQKFGKFNRFQRFRTIKSDKKLLQIKLFNKIFLHKSGQIIFKLKISIQSSGREFKLEIIEDGGGLVCAKVGKSLKLEVELSNEGI